MAPELTLNKQPTPAVPDNHSAPQHRTLVHVLSVGKRWAGCEQAGSKAAQVKVGLPSRCGNPRYFLGNGVRDSSSGSRRAALPAVESALRRFVERIGNVVARGDFELPDKQAQSSRHTSKGGELTPRRSRDDKAAAGTEMPSFPRFRDLIMYFARMFHRRTLATIALTVPVFAAAGALSRFNLRTTESRWQIAAFVALAAAIEDIAKMSGPNRLSVIRGAINATAAAIIIVSVKFDLEPGARRRDTGVLRHAARSVIHRAARKL